MRGLKHLVPKQTQDQLNQSPTFQWFVLAFVAVVGAFLVRKGVRAVRDGVYTGKHGKVYDGGTAKFLGVMTALIGALMAVGGVAAMAARLF